jgi:hypothetical protein
MKVVIKWLHPNIEFFLMADTLVVGVENANEKGWYQFLQVAGIVLATNGININSYT